MTTTTEPTMTSTGDMTSIASNLEDLLEELETESNQLQQDFDNLKNVHFQKKLVSSLIHTNIFIQNNFFSDL